MSFRVSAANMTVGHMDELNTFQIIHFQQTWRPWLTWIWRWRIVAKLHVRRRRHGERMWVNRNMRRSRRRWSKRRRNWRRWSRMRSKMRSSRRRVRMRGKMRWSRRMRVRMRGKMRWTRRHGRRMRLRQGDGGRCPYRRRRMRSKVDASNRRAER